MSERDGDTVKIPVPSADPEDRDNKNAPNVNSRKVKDAESTKVSEEDALLKEQVELLVTRVGDTNPQIASMALDQLVDLLRTQTGSVASVPKPLKFVRSMFPTLLATLTTIVDEKVARRLHDVVSFVGMTIEFPNGERGALKHKLLGTQDDLGSWGHEYLRFLAGEVSAEWKEQLIAGKDTSVLASFVTQIVRYMTAHQDEPSAIDLLMEIEEVQQVEPFVDEGNYKRVARYMEAVSRYLTRPADVEVLHVVFNIYKKMGASCDALRVALRLNDKERVNDLFAACTCVGTKLQMALMCARCRFFVDVGEQDELLADAAGNVRLSQMFRETAEKLDALAPKSPEDVFKTSTEGTAVPGVRGHLQHLATTLVSGLANCGFGKDTLLMADGTQWLYQAKGDRAMTATAALGLIHMWDHAEGLLEVNKYTTSDDVNLKAGALLAIGIIFCGVKMSFDPAIGLLAEYVTSPQKEIVSIGAILGLGFAYAAMQREDVKELLVPIMLDGERPLGVQCITAYALSLIFVGSADEDLTEAMLNTLLEIPDESLDNEAVRYLVLALGGLYLGRQEEADTLLDATQALSPLIQRYAEIVVRSCAYAATGNVVAIQNFFTIIAEAEERKVEEEANEGEANAAAAAPPAAESGGKAQGEATGTAKGGEGENSSKPKPYNHKAAAVLGIGLVALGEELGTEMAKRSIIHILLADSGNAESASMSGRRAVPLAYALLSASNPNMTVVETLSRLSHESDVPTALNAILAMGIVASGSNNARVSNMLRGLSSYHGRDARGAAPFVVRLAQGLTALGKAHLTLSPLQSDKSLVSPSALMGMLGLLHSALDMENTLLGKYHYMFLSIAPCINPRMVLAVDEEMNAISGGVQVRVGLPVDTVAVPGKPKAITGFQTSSTPFLLSETDRVEISTSKFKALSSIIEGIVVVKPTPEEE